MEIKFRDVTVDVIRTDLLVLPVVEKELEKSPLHVFDRRLKGKLRERIQKTNFTGSEGSTLFFPTAGVLPAANVLIIGMGKAADIEPDTWRRAAGRGRKKGRGV